MLVRGVLDSAVRHVLVELRLVNRVDRAETHRHCWELPEIGHEARVRIGRKPAREVGLLLTEPVELVLCETTLKVGARVHTGCCVALIKNLVSTAGVIGTAEKVVVPNLIKRCARRIRTDVASHTNAGSLCSVDHNS